MGNNEYRKRFYNRKIAVIIFSALIYECLWVLFVSLLGNSMDSDTIFNDTGYFVIFGVMGGWIVVTLARADNLSRKRAQDELALGPVPENFWRKRFRNVFLVAGILEAIVIGLLIYLGNFGMSTGAGVAFVFTIIALAFTQIVYGENLRKLRDGVAAGEVPELNTIEWSKESRNSIISALVQMVWGVIEMIWCWSEGEEGLAMSVLVGVMVVFIVAIVRMVSLRKLSDDEVMERWIRKQAEEKEAKLKEQEAAAAAAAERAKAKEREKEEETDARRYEKYGPAPRYTDCASLAALCEEFVRYAAENGTGVSLESAKEIFAAMSASRAVWLRHSDRNYATRIAMLLQRFFTDFENAVSVDASTKNPDALFNAGTWDGSRILPTLERQLYTAKGRTDSVNVLVFEVTEYTHFSSVFAPLINSFRAPEGENILSLGHTSAYEPDLAALSLPCNIWGIFPMSTEKLPAEVLEYGSVVSLTYGGGEYAQRTPEPREKVLSYSRFSELIAEAEQENFLALDVWKKFDRIEEYLQAALPFEITNPLARQMETYSSVLLACGTSAAEVTDRVLAEKLLPLLSGLKKEELDREGSTFFEFLDGLFGMDNIPLSQKALSDRNWV